MCKKYFDLPEGSIYSEDEYPRLKEVNIIPKDLKPSQVRNVPSVEIVINSEQNPFEIIEKLVNEENAWIFFHEEVLKTAMKEKYVNKYFKVPHLGEIFVTNFGIINVNAVDCFPDWKFVLSWRKSTELILRIPVEPEKVITVEMRK